MMDRLFILKSNVEDVINASYVDKEEVEALIVKFKGFEDYDFFVHQRLEDHEDRDSGGWRITEKQTGLYLVRGCQSEEEAYFEVSKRLNEKGEDEVRLAFEEMLKVVGL